MTHEERMALVKAARERYEAALGVERERFGREFYASTQRRMEISAAYAADLIGIGSQYAEANGLEVTA